MNKREYLFHLERILEHDTRITEYEKQLLQSILYNIKPDVNDVLNYIGNELKSELSEARLKLLIEEIPELFKTVNTRIQSQIETGVLDVYNKSGLYHADSLSLFQSLPVKNISESTIDLILKESFTDLSFADWIKTIYEKPVDDSLKQVIINGLDKDYKAIVKDLKSVTNISEFNLTSLTRTFVQGSNVSAQKEIFRKNPEYLQDNKVIWNAALENGYKQSGRGVCLRCAGLDGQEFELDKHPQIPLHIRCRCVLLPKTKSWEELGLSDETINKELRAYSIRNDKNIDKGGKRKLLEAGQSTDNNYGDWISKQSEKIQIETLGPKRYELLKQGKIKFSDLVDSKGGELILLKEL